MNTQTEVTLVEASLIIPTPDNPRTVKDDDALAELAHSIKGVGLLSPVIARPHPKQKGKLDLRAGERRYLACIKAGLDKIPVFIRELDDQEAAAVTVIENLHRTDLTAIEDAKTCDVLINSGMDIETAADKLGRKPDWVRRRRAVSKLLSPAWKTILQGDLTGWGIGHLEVVAALPPSFQKKLLTAVRKDLKGSHYDPRTWRIADVRKKFQHQIRSLDSVPWDLDDEDLVKKAGSCTGCPKRSTACPDLPGLLGDDEGGDQCTDRSCYDSKEKAAANARIGTFKKEHGTELLLVGWGFSSLKCVGVKCVDQYMVTACKKKEKGSRPALKVDGFNVSVAEQVHYVKLRNTSTGSSTPANGPKTMDQKRRQLALRRTRLAGTEFRKFIDKTSYSDFIAMHKDPDLAVFKIAVQFGTDHRNNYGRWTKVKEPRSQLYAEVRTVASQWLKHELEQTLDSMDDKACISLAKIWKTSWPKLMKAAAAKLPEPKAWKRGADNG